MRVALVSCVKSKLSGPAAAKDLYTSQLFRAQREYAEVNADAWYILSAEYGLVSPDEMLAPYERTLNRMLKKEREEWAEKVVSQLRRVLPSSAEIIILAGERYREGVIPALQEAGYKISMPLKGLRLGKQLQRLKELNATDSRSPHIDRFYDLVSRLASLPGQGRRLRECSGRLGWPDRGVYFFREPGEYRAARPEEMRIVRVGTHAVSTGSRSSLWGRLRAHRGPGHGRGNHRGSIFRLHVGNALLSCEGGTEPSTWAVGQSAPRDVRMLEAELEKRVSAYLGEMTVFWLAVPDEPGPTSERAAIERNSIALLSNGLRPTDPPSKSWLGRHSNRKEIRDSGLWNLNHVQAEVDTVGLEIFERRLTAMEAIP